MTWGNWWSRNVYSLGTNSPEINEGAIVGGGGTRGGFESKLKRNTEQPSGALGARCKGFLLRYFGFEMELKTYLSLTGQARGGSLPNPGEQLSSYKAWGTERKPQRWETPRVHHVPPVQGKLRIWGVWVCVGGRQEPQSISSIGHPGPAAFDPVPRPRGFEV